MPTSIQRSRYEAGLAAALRGLHRADTVAQEIGDHGAQEDLYRMRMALREMMDESLRNRAHRVATDPAQMHL